MEQYPLNRSISILLLTLLAPTLSFAQATGGRVNHVIASNVFGGERTVDVFLPEAYSGEDSTRTFVTAYVLDGQFEPYFSMVSSMMSYYEQTDEGVPMVVVGIHTTNRWDEFVPVEGVSDGAQGADRLSEFLRSEVIPLIEANYRVKPFRMGIGHSLGGTYVIHEMTKDNSLFQAGITASPNLTIDDDRIVRNMRDFYQRAPDNKRFFHTHAGTVGDMENDFRRSLLRLDSTTRSMDLPNMYWSCTIGEGQGHMTTFVPCFNDGYLALSARVQLRDEELLRMAKDSSTTLVEALAAFHARSGELLGEPQQFGSSGAMAHASTLMQYEEFQHALDLITYAEKQLVVGTEEEQVKEKAKEHLQKGRSWATFNLLAAQAKAKADNREFAEAGRLYKEAFATGEIRATHIVRIASIPVFAQARDNEEAFHQLELLADTFKLAGNEDFINDERCGSLRRDRRWGLLMKKLAENTKLYE